jgi:hypothetical protein
VLGLVTIAAVACSGDDDKPAATTTTASTSTSSSTSTTVKAAVTTSAAPQAATVITESGIGKLRLGMTVAQAKATGEIGTVGPGCELGGPGELAADLHVGTATGTVTFREDVVVGFMVRSGAKTEKGIGPGSTLAQIQQAYAQGYEIKTDDSYKEQFGFTLVTVYRGKQVFDFDVDADSKKVGAVWVPRVQLCE